FERTANQFVKSCLRLQIAPVGSEMNSGENDFFIAARHQIAYFGKSRFWFDAAAAAAHRRNDAEGTVRVAAMLHFDHRAGLATGTGVRCGLELALEENAAAQDLRAAMRLEAVTEKVGCKLADQRFMRIPHDVTNRG